MALGAEPALSLQEECHPQIDDLFSGKLYLIGIAAIVVAVIMVSVVGEGARLGKGAECWVLMPCLPTTLDLRDDSEHGVVLWDPQQLRVLIAAGILRPLYFKGFTLPGTPGLTSWDKGVAPAGPGD